MPAGNLANASLVGANTVKGPAPFNVSTRPAAFTAATKVVWSAEPAALSTISFEATILAPPTITPCSSAGFIGSVVVVVVVSILDSSVLVSLQATNVTVVNAVANNSENKFFCIKMLFFG